MVVNLSLGSDYGPHDGTSDLEKGLSAFVGDDKPGRAIVVAAGNSGGALPARRHGRPCGVHTEVHVSPDEETRVPIVAAAAQNGQAFVWITFQPGRRRLGGARRAGRRELDRLHRQGEPGRLQDGTGSGAIQAGVVNDLPDADDPAITPDTNSAVVVFTGHWDEQQRVRRAPARLGRRLALGDRRRATRRGRRLFFERALRQGTINVPATAPALLAVGCTVNRIEWKPLAGKAVELGALGDDTNPTPDSACFFSSGGADARRRAEARDQRARRLRRRGHERRRRPARHTRAASSTRRLPLGRRATAPWSTTTTPSPRARRCRRRT